MWVRNYYNLLTAAFLEDTNATRNDGFPRPSDYSTPIKVAHKNGTYFTPTAGSIIPVSSSYGQLAPYIKLLTALTMGKTNMAYTDEPSSTGMGVMFGSGSTPATYDDINIVSPITSGITLDNTNGNLETTSHLDGTHIKSTRSYTFTNTGSSTLSVREFGIFVAVTYGTNYGPWSCLVYREVFDETISLAPGESIILKFNRDSEPFNYQPY